MAQDHAHDHDGDDHDHDDMDACIEACLQSHVVCTMTAQYCLIQGGEHAAVERVGVLLDCAQLCQVSADFLVRGSPYHALTCGACAALCRACEEACRSLPDEELAHCADVCAACAEQCERMAAEDEDAEAIDG